LGGEPCCSLPSAGAAAAALAVSSGRGHRNFASTALTVRGLGAAPEQTLFVVGLDEGKFFGQDGAEEGLKLLERVAEHQSGTQILFGLTEKDLAAIEEDYKVKNQRLTPSRELEGARNCEMIPIIQAGMVDKLDRLALGRPLKTTQGHTAWQLWKHPREGINLYWAYWRRKDHRDAAQYAFWSKHFPVCSHSYFDERAEIIAIRAVEHLMAARSRSQGGSTVLVVHNELFGLVSQRLGLMLDDDAPRKLTSAEFSQHLRDRAVELCADIPDLTPLIIFVYLGIPLAVLHFVILGMEYYLKRADFAGVLFEAERRE